MGARFEVCDEPSAFELTYLSTFFFSMVILVAFNYNEEPFFFKARGEAQQADHLSNHG